MKDLLTAIQAQLRTDLTYIRDSDIYITPHENYIPPHARFPCVGIKDGDEERDELSRGKVLEIKRTVILVVYVKLAKPESAVMGDAVADKKGVLDIVEDIHDALHGDDLDLSSISHVFCPAVKPSEMFGDDQEYIQKKVLAYEYTQEETP